MSYRRRSSPKPWLVVRRKGNSPIRVVSGERFRTKKKAEKEARELNKAYKGLMSNSWCARRIGEENAGTPDFLFPNNAHPIARAGFFYTFIRGNSLNVLEKKLGDWRLR